MTSADRMLVGLSTSVLLRRDNSLVQMDRLVPISTKEALRTAPLLAPSLFGDEATSALTDLEDARVQNKPTQAIREMVQFTKALVVKKPAQQTGNRPGFKRPAQSKPVQFSAAPKANPMPVHAGNPSSSVAPPTKKRRFRGPKKQRGGKQ